MKSLTQYIVIFEFNACISDAGHETQYHANERMETKNHYKVKSTPQVCIHCILLLGFVIMFHSYYYLSCAVSFSIIPDSFSNLT